jgi:hypothetical protein
MRPASVCRVLSRVGRLTHSISGTDGSIHPRTLSWHADRVAASTWEELTAELDDADLALLTAYRDGVRALPGVTERVSKTEVAYLVKRQFTSAYVRNHYLEIAVHLTREAEHPLLRARFPTTTKVTTHRLTLTRPDQFDGDLLALVDEAREAVGPGTR